MKVDMSFDKSVDQEYLNIHYGLEKEHLKDGSGIYAIYSKNSGETDLERTGILTFLKEASIYVKFSEKFTKSWDGIGFDLEFENGDSLTFYYYEEA